MSPSHSHWLRRIWEAYQRVPREGVTPSRRTPRRATDPDPARAARVETGQRDDFEETRPLVFPLH